MITCEICGKEIFEEDAFDIESEQIHVCEDCLHEHFIECEECGEYVRNYEIIRIYNGWRYSDDFICEECAKNNEKYQYCGTCNEWINTEKTEIYTDPEGNPICSQCYDENVRECHECYKIIWDDDAEYDEDTEEYYCQECSARMRHIKNYGYKPAPTFKTKHDSFNTSKDIKELLFGVENEIDKGCDPYDTAGEICSASEDVYAKHDGSLTETGIELVTHPCTLEYHQTELGWDKICEIAKSHNYKSHDARTCGLHVHVGKRQLGESEEESEDTIAKIIMLVDRHRKALTNFSRRREEQLRDWAEFPCLGLSEKVSENEAKNRALNIKYSGRYQAVNLTNYDTIEFRLFNGTLKYQTIIATLELVSNICKFAKENNISKVMSSTWKDIVNWERHEYLEEYNKARGLTNVEDPKPIELGKQ